MAEFSAMLVYQLWDTETGNLIGEFDDETDALVAMRDAFALNGREYAEALALGTIDDTGHPEHIAVDADLVNRALHATSPAV